MNNTIKLTQYSHGSGCGCKLSPGDLSQLLQSHRSKSLGNLWVGNEWADDAAVWGLNEQEGLVSTVDFFAPIVDDPYYFGRIAAANALSDVFAMGGQPIFALAILGWPIDKLPLEAAALAMQGARDACGEVGISIVGGHSIDTPSPIFGLAVNGLVPKQNLKKNAGAQPGDLLYLTKPLGVGSMATALKREKLQEEHEALLHELLGKINHLGLDLGAWPQLHSMTDVTGFGLMGHAIEMAEASGLSLEIEFSKVPIIPEAKIYFGQHIVADATYRNWKAYSEKVKIKQTVDPMLSFQALADPQTNGGLLLAVAPQAQEEVENFLTIKGVHSQCIGSASNRKELPPLWVF